MYIYFHNKKKSEFDLCVSVYPCNAHCAALEIHVCVLLQHITTQLYGFTYAFHRETFHSRGFRGNSIKFENELFKNMPNTE